MFLLSICTINFITIITIRVCTTIKRIHVTSISWFAPTKCSRGRSTIMTAVIITIIITTIISSNY